MRALVGILAALGLLIAACGGAGSPPTQPGPTAAPPAATGAATPAPAASPAADDDDYDYGY